MSEPLVALVTGASTGIGSHIADTLGVAGFRVYGTSRSRRPDRPNVEMRELDVGDPASVTRCVDRIVDEAGRIDLLVSNAGVTHVAPEEEMPIDLARTMMNVNFFGAARVTNAVLPQMRARRSGRLVYISSLGGQMGVPGQGYYCSTKHALEAYADALYLELQRFSIHVSIIEPGSYRTGILEHADRPPEWTTYADYDEIRARMPEVIMEQTRQGQDPQRVADLVERVARKEAPRLRYPVSRADRRALRLKRWLPERMFYDAVGKMFGL